MATSVYKTTEVELMDGTKIECRPLKISLLRKFMKAFEGLDGVVEDNDKSLDVLINCVSISMNQFKPELADVEKLEDVLDMPTMYKIIEAASGIKLGDDDPNLTGAGLSGQT